MKSGSKTKKSSTVIKPFVIILLLLALPILFLYLDKWHVFKKVRWYYNQHVSFKNTNYQPTYTPGNGRRLQYGYDVLAEINEAENAKFYPQELLNLKKEDLIAMDCETTEYWQMENEEYEQEYSDLELPNDKRESDLSREQKNAFISQLGKSSGLDADEIGGNSFCYLESGNMVVVLMTNEKPDLGLLQSLIPMAYAGGGGGTNSHVYYIEKPNMVSEIAYIPEENIAYWGCRRVIGVTNNGELYLACGGGDGGGPGSYLIKEYKVNIKTKKITELYSCTNVLDETGNIVNKCS